MSNEIFSRDQNHVTVLGAITNDVAQDVRMLRVDPATGRLIVSAVIAGTNNGQLKVTASDTTYGYLATKLVAGNGVTLTVINPGANETLQIDVSNPGYDEVQENGVPVTQRSILNFVYGFDVTDNALNLSTDIAIDESELDLGLMGGLLDLSTQVTGQLTATYIDQSTLDLALIGGLLDLSTQVTGQLSSTYIDITNLESNLDLANIAGQIDLTTQVSGVLPLANGGTGENLSDPGYDAAMVWDNTLNEVRFAQLSGLSYNSGTNTLTATGGGTIISATAAQDLTAGQPVGLSASLNNEVALALLTRYIQTSITNLVSISNIAEIAPDKYAICYEDVYSVPLVFVAQINRDTMTVTIGNINSLYQGGGRVAKLDTDKYVVVYYRSGPQDIQDRVFSVSGVTSTQIGTNTYSGASGSVNSITSAGTDRIVYTNRDGFTPTGTKMQSITYSGGSGSAGTQVTVDSFSGSIYIVDYIDTDTIMTSQITTLGSSTSVPVTVYTLTGNTIGSGTNSSIGTLPSNNSRSLSVSVVSPGVFMLRAQRTFAPVFSNLYLCSLSGSTVTVEQTSATDTDGEGTLTPIGVSNKVYETCNTGVTATNRINEITVSGTSFTKKVASIGLIFEAAPIITLDSTNGYYSVFNKGAGTTIPTHIQGMSNNFIGIAQSTVSRGSTLPVLIKGIDNNQSGLSSGNTYIVSNGAFTLSGDPTLPNKGVAVTPTSIEI